MYVAMLLTDWYVLSRFDPLISPFLYSLGMSSPNIPLTVLQILIKMSTSVDQR